MAFKRLLLVSFDVAVVSCLLLCEHGSKCVCICCMGVE